MLPPLSVAELQAWRRILMADREEMDASGMARIAKLRPQTEVGLELSHVEMAIFYIRCELQRRGVHVE